ncbi:MAG: 50S ribosomal protein L34 [Patescibacteria group bacterium]|nr:50S ribosomal protein L34 [Patescibacteria group bacterium]
MSKRTLNPSLIKKIRKHGFRSRNSSKKGKLVMKRRLIKGRYRISF